MPTFCFLFRLVSRTLSAAYFQRSIKPAKARMYRMKSKPFMRFLFSILKITDAPTNRATMIGINKRYFLFPQLDLFFIRTVHIEATPDAPKRIRPLAVNSFTDISLF